MSNEQTQVWQPLEGSFYKLNFDASVFEDMAAFGIGAVIWNDIERIWQHYRLKAQQ